MPVGEWILWAVVTIALLTPLSWWVSGLIVSVVARGRRAKGQLGKNGDGRS